MYNLPNIFCYNESDFKYLYIEGADSGGFTFKDIVYQVVKTTGLKPHYKHAHEWCCGHGIMGFNLLRNNLCDKLTLSDIDYNCMIGVRFTSSANNIDNKVTPYLIEQFSDIPIPSQPWDLIITNPPYVPDVMFYQKGEVALQDRLKDMWVDPDWKAHKNFFANVKKYIDPECDIYMFGISPFSDQQIEIAKQNGFKFIQKYSDLKIPGNEIIDLLHFRPA